MKTKKRCVIGLALMMFVIVVLVICNNEKAYADEKVSYFVRYLDEEGGEISSSVIGYANMQEEIVVTAKEIEGYAARQNEQKIVIDKNNIEIVFNYVKEKTVVVEDKTSEVDDKKVFDLIKKDDVEYEVVENNKASVRKKEDDKVVSNSKTKMTTNVKKSNSSNAKKENKIKSVSTSKPVYNTASKNSINPTEKTVDVDDNEQGVPNYMKPYTKEDTQKNNSKSGNNNTVSIKVITIITCVFAVVILLVGGIWTIKNRKEIFN